MSRLRPDRGLSPGAEAVAALIAGIGSFVFAAVLLAIAEPHVPVVFLGLGYIVLLVVIAHFWGIAFAVPMSVACVVALDWYAIPPTHPFEMPSLENIAALAAYLVTGVLLGQVAAHARRRAEVSESARAALADEQAALRRVATLVASQPSPREVFGAVAEEVGKLLGADFTGMLRYETDGHATVVALWSRSGMPVSVGARVPLDGSNVTSDVHRTHQPARIDDFESATGGVADLLRGLGVESAAGCPILVDGHLWGVMIAAATGANPLPAETTSRVAEFTELVATAIDNAETRAELAASRARIVATGDETRRRLERDLHDGVQQRLVSLALVVRAEAIAPGEPEEVRTQLNKIGDDLSELLDEVREISHGIHPAILSNSGLGPALATLARRSAVPVELTVQSENRFPEQVEVAAYYLVSEALTNTAKHAKASVIHVDVGCDLDVLRISIRDDGVGGADPSDGSGLVGLRDRVEALGGRISIDSPPGDGTSLLVSLPVQLK